MLDRLEDIRKRSIRYAPAFQQDPFDIFACERVPLNRVRSPRVERPGASPHARRECLQWSSGEQFVPELGQYGLQHVLVIYHTLYLRIYGHTTSQSNIPYHLDGSKGRKRGSPLPGGAFLRQRRGEADPACHPSLEPTACAVSRRRHEEPTRHGAGPGKIERLRARFLQHRVGRGRLDPYNEIVAVDADAHVAAQEEGDFAEQLLLGDAFAARERLAGSRGLGLRIRHAGRGGGPWAGSKTL